MPLIPNTSFFAPHLTQLTSQRVARRLPGRVRAGASGRAAKARLKEASMLTKKVLERAKIETFFKSRNRAGENAILHGGIHSSAPALPQAPSCSTPSR